jgi:hypothetical protein
MSMKRPCAADSMIDIVRGQAMDELKAILSAHQPDEVSSIQPSKSDLIWKTANTKHKA